MYNQHSLHSVVAGVEPETHDVSDELLREHRKFRLETARKPREMGLLVLLEAAGAEIPTNNTDPYIVRVRNAGGFKKYEQAHLSRITSILAPTPLLPPELVRKVLEFWLHAGYY